jgi:GT2 family glycosyltransferase
LPNEARSLVVREAKTPYIVFIDNDVVVTPGWLDPLVRCAKSTSACIVSPIVCLGRPFHTYIHCAGGVVEIEERVENRRLRRRLVERLRFAGRRIDEVADRLIPGPTGLAEFHCMLVRKEVFERLGNLDLNMMNTREHIDLCLSVKAAGGGIYLEPRSVVTYDQGATRSVSDVLYYIHRWSTARVLYSIRHLRRKWSLDEDRLSIGAYSWYRYLLLLPEPARPFFRWILQPQVQRVGTWIVENFARPRPRILKEGREYTVLRPDPDRNGAA